MLTRLAALVLTLACLGAGGAAAEAPPHGAAQTSYDELPVGAPTALPWWQRGELHVGDTVIETKLNDLASRNGTTVVAADEVRRRDRPTTWSLFDGQRLMHLPMRARADQPLVSANGRWLAWLEVRAARTDSYRRVERYRVVIYDVRRLRIATAFRDRRLVAWEDGINGIWLRTLGNDGRLVLSRGDDGVRVLAPHGRLVRFGGPEVGNSASLDGWPRGTTVYRFRTGRSVYGELAPGGRFERAGSFRVSFSGLWSGDGSGYAYVDYGSGDLGYWVRPLDGGRVTLDVPGDVGEFRVVGWESADAVVLWQVDDYSSHPSSHLVRCSATTGACEQVPGGPVAGSRATMPSFY